MNILFRVDAYPEIGLGHFVRSIAIASELKKDPELKIIFIGTFSKNSHKTVKNNGFQLYNPTIDEDELTFINRITSMSQFGLIYFDNLFPYNKSFILKLRKKVKVVFFHNLCSGAYHSDTFILPSAHHPDKILNDKRWKENEVAFYSGFKYIPINNAIKNLRREKVSSKNTNVISLTTGGSDPEGVMLRMLNWINNANFKNVMFYALIGESFIKKQELNDLIPKLSSSISIKKFNYEQLVNSDIVISTFGVTSYELFYLGIPFISISHADKNAEGSKILSERYPMIKDLGHVKNIQAEVFIKTLNESIKNQELAKSFHKMSGILMDNKGIKRIITVIKSQLQKI